MKRWKKLLLLSLCLALLTAGVYGASRLEAEPAAQTGEGGDKLLSFDAEQASSLSISGADSLLFEKSGGSWSYTGDESFPLSEGRVTALLTELADISAEKTIEEPEALEQYGLAQPLLKIGLSAGESLELHIGNESPVDGFRYVSVGDGKVYLVSGDIYDTFSLSLLDMAEKEVLPAMDNILCFTVSSGDKSYELVYLEDSGLAYSDEYVWFLHDGEDYLALDTVAADSLVSSVAGLSWGDCVSYRADAAELAAWGLAEPALRVEIDYMESVKTDTGMKASDGGAIYDERQQEQSFTLEIGAYSESGCYARIAGSQMVYLIDASICDSLIHAGYESLQPDEVLVMDFEEVTALDIELSGESYSLRRSSASEAGDDGGDVNIWTLDGRPADIQSALDQLCLMIPSSKGGLKTPEGEAELLLVFHRDRESFSRVELAFYRYDSDSCLVSLNGEARLLVDRSGVSSVISSLEAGLAQAAES